MANFDLPSNNPVANEDGIASMPWLSWFQRIHSICTAMQQSGVTADRPTSLLWIGRRYYDETINKPVYLRAIRPNVWRDAMGNIV
jgi:hypothetical protein